MSGQGSRVSIRSGFSNLLCYNSYWGGETIVDFHAITKLLLECGKHQAKQRVIQSPKRARSAPAWQQSIR